MEDASVNLLGAVSSSLTIEKACERIAELGLEAVDFWPGNFDCPHLDEIEKRLGSEGNRSLRQEVRERGISMRS